jgi:hypothetical protein
MREEKMAKRVYNKAIMNRFDDLENRNILVSTIYLLYLLGIAFLIGYFLTENIMLILSGVICHVFGLILALKIANKL